MEDVGAKVNSLNVQYQSMRASGQTQVTCLLSLVAKTPYRLMSKAKNVCWTLDFINFFIISLSPRS